MKFTQFKKQEDVRDTLILEMMKKLDWILT